MRKRVSMQKHFFKKLFGCQREERNRVITRGESRNWKDLKNGRRLYTFKILVEENPVE